MYLKEYTDETGVVHSSPSMFTIQPKVSPDRELDGQSPPRSLTCITFFLVDSEMNLGEFVPV